MAAEEKAKEKFTLGSKEIQDSIKEAMQRHHDYYVGREERGELSEEDRPNFELAMRREREGLVQPLNVEPVQQSGE